jgi:uncharacterized protein YndB with AHSA1/START domain
MDRVTLKEEFIFRASPAIVYKFLSTPSCLTRWFCDEVDINGEEYTFVWSGAAEVATLIDDYEDELLRFQWDEAEDEEEFLEFKMYKSPVTGETILEVTDYCDEDELDEQRQLWQTQIERMRSAMGG